MAVHHYEGMFLVDSAKYATDSEGVTKHITGILTKAGATIVAEHPWQDGKLAYAVDGHRKGLHFLVLFELKPTSLADVIRACKLSETILRQIILRQPKVIFDAMNQAVSTHTTQAPPEDVAEPPEDDRPRRRPRRDDAPPPEEVEE